MVWSHKKWVLLFLLSLGLGFLLTYPGYIVWDIPAHILRNHWLMAHLNFFQSPQEIPQIPFILKWYTPLWEMVLGLFTDYIFFFLNDSIWVRHAVTFSLYPMTLLLTAFLLVQAGVSGGTACLAVAFLFGLIRLGGHALVNPIDFPFACLYWLCTLYLWVVLRQGHEKNLKGKHYPVWTLVGLGVVSMIPYLIRNPALSHFLGLFGFILLYGILVARDEPWTKRIGFSFIPLFSGLCFMYLTWPVIREIGGWKGWLEWLRSFNKFAYFQFRGEIKVFGHILQNTDLPFWYYFAWLPVSINPLSFLGLVCGSVCGIRYANRLTSYNFILETSIGKINLTLTKALILFSALSWGGMIWVRPFLYDEERHLLFLYPPLLVLAALGLDFLSEKVKWILSAVVMVSSLFSYAEWGRYSYVYKSPLVFHRSSSQFMGDYWGSCIAQATTSIAQIESIPPQSKLVIEGPYEVVLLQLKRLGKAKKFEVFGSLEGISPPYYLIAFNREGRVDRLIRDIGENKAHLLWKTTMPPADIACAIGYYPGF